MSCKHPMSAVNARSAAMDVMRKLSIDQPIPVGIVLGSGWGDALDFRAASQPLPLEKITGFGRLQPLAGHDRQLMVGTIGSTRAAVLRGRIHLYESPDVCSYEMVRLQVEMLFQLGVKTLILTGAAGSLGSRAKVGELVLIDGFATLYAPRMPLYGGEFISPEDAIDGDLAKRVYDKQGRCGELRVKTGGYAMVPGPFYEGRKYDKPLLAATGASVVGMSMLPEACIAALYRDEDPAKDVRILPVSYVSNDDTEEHAHETVLERTRDKAKGLGEFLEIAVSCIDRTRR